MRRFLVVLTCFVFVGCAGWFMVGSKRSKGRPTESVAVCTVPQCKSLADGSSIDGPKNQTYYLTSERGRMALYELDETSSGAMITNHWADEEGDHFFTYVRSSHGWEYVFPSKPGAGPKRLVFPKGTYSTGRVDGVEKVVSGAAQMTCPMVCEWNEHEAKAAGLRIPPIREATDAGATRCTKDTECPGEQICERGMCKGDSTGAAPATAGPACSKDTECPGSHVCVRGHCTTAPSVAPTDLPDASAPTPPSSASAVAPPASPPAGSPPSCTRNADCPGEQYYCSKGQCTLVPGAKPDLPACKKTADCPADTICKNHKCVAPKP